MSENNPSDIATDLRLCQGRDDEAKTSTSTGSRGPRGKNAQYYRDYRARKQKEQEKESLNRTSGPSTTANSCTINVAGSVTSKKRKSAAEYQREYRARKKAKRYNILIDSLAVIPSISTGGFTTTHQSTIVDQLTTAGPSTSSDRFAKPTRRKTPAEYQREYRAKKKAQRESKRAAKTNNGSMEITDKNTSNIGDENARINPQVPYSQFHQHKKAHNYIISQEQDECELKMEIKIEDESDTIDPLQLQMSEMDSVVGHTISPASKFCSDDNTIFRKPVQIKIEPNMFVPQQEQHKCELKMEIKIENESDQEQDESELKMEMKIEHESESSSEVVQMTSPPRVKTEPDDDPHMAHSSTACSSAMFSATLCNVKCEPPP